MNGWTCADVGTAAFQGYAPQQVQTQLQLACREQQPSGLPFTGLDLTLLLLIAVILLMMGAALRRVGR